MSASPLQAKIPRAELIKIVTKRDGFSCAYPGCEEVLDFSIKDGPMHPTLDHHYPVTWCRANGWTYDEIWNPDNLRLMHKKCNARKANRIPNEDGTLPPRTGSKFVRRAVKRANRPELCTTCNSGRLLKADEFCDICGSGPQPSTFPKWAKCKPNDCPHAGAFSCWACMIGIVDREPAIVSVLDGNYLE